MRRNTLMVVLVLVTAACFINPPVMPSPACAQTAKKKGAEPLLAATPQRLWQYDTGG